MSGTVSHIYTPMSSPSSENIIHHQGFSPKSQRLVISQTDYFLHQQQFWRCHVLLWMCLAGHETEICCSTFRLYPLIRNGPRKQCWPSKFLVQIPADPLEPSHSYGSTRTLNRTYLPESSLAASAWPAECEPNSLQCWCIFFFAMFAINHVLIEPTAWWIDQFPA